jgi:hypothetical protein
MIENKDETIDGMDFHFQPLPALTALKLDKQIVSLIVPALGGLKDLSLDTKVDLKLITQGIGEALSGLKDEETEKLVLSLLSYTLYKPSGAAPYTITKEKFNQLFTGILPTVYKLIFAVMKYNKFSPFVLMEGGNAMGTMFTSMAKVGKEKMIGKESAPSGN